MSTPPPTSTRVLAEGRFLRLVDRDGWEFVERGVGSGVIGVVAVTDDRRLVLVEQFRPPIGASVIELPAGIAGDLEHARGESFADAARRELYEETGYEAETMEPIGRGMSSAGLSDEEVHLFHARGLKRTGPGGGDETESITVHEVPLIGLPQWLDFQLQRGLHADVKLYAALYFATQPSPAQ